jgi:hypothetical protein
MFSKKERLMVGNVDPNTLLQNVHNTMQQQAIVPIAPAAGGGFLGMGQNAGYGVKPKVSVSVFPGPGGHAVDINVVAEFDQSSYVVVILLFVFFWPIAALLIFLAYQAFEQRATYAINALRASLGPYAMAAPAPALPGPQYPPQGH